MLNGRNKPGRERNWTALGQQQTHSPVGIHWLSPAWGSIAPSEANSLQRPPSLTPANVRPAGSILSPLGQQPQWSNNMAGSPPPPGTTPCNF